MEQKIRRDLNMGADFRVLRDKSGLSQESCVPSFSEEAVI